MKLTFLYLICWDGTRLKRIRKCVLWLLNKFAQVLAVSKGVTSVVLDWIFRTEKSIPSESQHWYMWASY